MYTSWSVVAGEIPTAAKWNILGTNDAYFNSQLIAARFKPRYTWLKDYDVFTETQSGIVYPVTSTQLLKKLYAKTQSGTATFTIKKTDGTVLASGVVADSDGVEVTSFTNDDLADGDFIQLDITAVSSGKKLSILLEAEEALAFV